MPGARRFCVGEWEIAPVAHNASIEDLSDAAHAMDAHVLRQRIEGIRGSIDGRHEGSGSGCAGRSMRQYSRQSVANAFGVPLRYFSAKESSERGCTTTEVLPVPSSNR